MSTGNRGLVAGLLATLVLALLKLLTDSIGALGELDTVRLLAAASSEYFGTAASPLVGWVLFFLVGALWGLVFGWIFHRLAGGSAPVKGMVFGIFAWGVMMVFFMPVAGAGWFGVALGPAAPVFTLLGHLIFGAVMGLFYERLPSRAVTRTGEG